MQALSDQKTLFLTKGLLIMVIFIIAISSKSIATFPIVGWTMYSQYPDEYPDDVASAVNIKVSGNGMETIDLMYTDFMPLGRKEIIEKIISNAFNQSENQVSEDCRRYLAATITRIWAVDEGASVQCWETFWRVDPLSVTPLVKSDPLEKQMIGSFIIKDYLPNAL